MSNLEEHDFTHHQLRLLSIYLSSTIRGFAGPIDVHKFAFGQSNPTYQITSASGVCIVLRRKPYGTVIPSAHAVEREFYVMKALGDQGQHEPRFKIPVPAVYGLCQDPDIIGSVFYVMEYVPGRIFTDPSLPSVNILQNRTLCYIDSIKILARLHSLDWQKLGLQFSGLNKQSQDPYYLRQMRRLSRVAIQQEAMGAPPIPNLRPMETWFTEHVPTEHIALVHGDYKLDNIIFHPRDPTVVAILDWELCTIGHPLSDLANFCGMYYIPYSSHGEVRGLLGFDFENSGIPSENDILRIYEEEAGWRINRQTWEYCKAFFFFKYSVIAQGVVARAKRGIASSKQTGQIERYIPLLATVAQSFMQNLAIEDDEESKLTMMPSPKIAASGGDNKRHLHDAKL